MHLMNFEQSISKTYITRGKKYFRDGHVVELEQLSPAAWRADVEGTDDYFVFVELADEEIVTSACNCPFDGPVCKHEVAVYFALRKAFAERKRAPLPEAVRSQSKEELLVMLEQMVHDFPALLRYFEGEKVEAENSMVMTMREAQLVIAKNVNRYSDYDGYIDDEAAFEGLYKVLQAAGEMVEEQPIEAVQLVLLCFEEAEELEDGCEEWLYEDLMARIHETSAEVVACVNTELAAKQVTEYLLQELEMGLHDESIVMNMLVELTVLAGSRERIEQLLPTLYLDDEELERYRFDLAMKCGNAEEIQRYYKKESMSAMLRTELVDYAVSRGDIEEALTLLADGIDEVGVSGLHKTLWLKKAFHLHGKQQNIGAQRVIAFELALQGTMEDVDRLKALYTDDAELWGEVLESYLVTLEESELPWHYMPLLAREGQWARLMRVCQLEPSYALAYAEVLMPHYEAEVKQIVTSYLQDKAARATSRPHYRDVARDLVTYAKIDRAHALELKQLFMSTYAKKRAFMDELGVLH